MDGLDFIAVKKVLSEIDQAVYQNNAPVLYSIVHRFMTDELKETCMSPDAFRKCYKRMSLEQSEALDKRVEKSLHDSDCISLLNVVRELERQTGPTNAVPLGVQTRAGTVMELSWDADYLDSELVDEFLKHVQHWYLTLGSSLYALSISIIQSSGMGKSRLVHELGKIRYTIPVNLNTSDTGYPPPDYRASQFLLSGGTQQEAYLRCSCWLIALFERTQQCLKGLELKGGPLAFQDYMTRNTTNVGNAQRSKFHRDIDLRATQLYAIYESNKNAYYERLLSTRDTTVVSHLQHALKDLLCFVDDDYKSLVKAHGLDNPAPLDTLHSNPILFLYFDEAQVLANNTFGASECSVLTELRRALHDIRRYPLLSIFLSTSGVISRVIPSPAPPRTRDPSTRIQLNVFRSIPPWTTLGFDQMIRDHKFTGQTRLSSVVNFKISSRFGRPLWGLRFSHGNATVRSDLLFFAVRKLFGSEHALDDNKFVGSPFYLFAALAQRLPLELNSTTYEGCLHEQLLVESHMRVCMKIENSYRSAWSTNSPSEPILSEAASLFMRAHPQFSMSDCLRITLSDLPIAQGDRGELIAMALLTVARDNIVKSMLLQIDRLPTFSVYSFLQNLFATDISTHMPSFYHSQEGINLKEQFKGSYMHFSHFIKPHTQALPKSRSELLPFIARGAAVVSASNMASWDILLPYLFWDDRLESWNVGYILIQVKNDTNYCVTHVETLLDSMDPFTLGILEPDDVPVPMVRIVLSLTREVPKLHQIKMEKPRSQADFTTYDYFCEGLSENVYKPITSPKDAKDWDDVLRNNDSNMYKDHIAGESFLRRQYPLHTEEQTNAFGHWEEMNESPRFPN